MMLQSEDIPYGSQNLCFVEEIYERYREDPDTVELSWRRYFENLYDSPQRDGTYDHHVTADPHPIIHGAEDSRTGLLEKIHKFLRRVPMFRNIATSELVALEAITQEIRVEANQSICRQGQVGNDLFFIKEGAVAVMRDGEEIAVIGEGEMVGELAVFDARPRSADIIAKSDGWLLRIARDDLHRLLQNHSELSIALLRALASRLRDAGARQEQVDSMIWAYRERGHVISKLDPLGRIIGKHPELNPEHYGFKESDFDLKFPVNLGGGTSSRSLRDILEYLKKTYCQAIGAQYMHIDNLHIQDWIRVRMEEPAGQFTLRKEEQIRILKKLTDAELFENFLHRKFVGAKRFSLEGSESMIPLLDYAIEEAGGCEIDEVIIGMAHRGRLNVLVNIMDKPASQVFREFQDIDPELHRGKGDVKYHLGYGCDRVTLSGRKVHLSLCFNPSHLEFVGPVTLGRVRAKQDRFGDLSRSRALPLIIHGDAAFIGQGVTQEVFNLSELPGYRTGGTVHVILNNQIGFTTDPEDSRSSHYSTDIARMLQIPIFHVNGEHPEAVAFVVRLAMEFRREFKKDVVIDMYGYRKYGHNEGDDASFTQPRLYARIKKRKTVREAYVANLLKLGGISEEETREIAEESRRHLETEFQISRDPHYAFQHHSAGKGIWKPFLGGRDKGAPDADTSFPREELVSLLKAISVTPEGFTPHPKIKRFLKAQLEMAKGEKPLTWGAGEALAFATLLNKGTRIRLTGQDTERGTFSHRHAVLHDHKTGELFVPLRHLPGRQGDFEIYNSPLSETAVLGFEYGYSLDMPNGLVLWEAQFGDFCNVAQVIIDQFITSSEEKWARLNSLCLLLPHGFEGQGPEHSSARLERFLMLSAMDNIQVVNLTTPAQLFHCLRRQVLRPLRKPLVVMAPKSLLRYPRAVSRLEDLAEGRFQRVIPDTQSQDPSEVERILLCSGKIYYELEEMREREGLNQTAITRMEQYYPLPMEELESALQPYRENVPVYWVQEEPLNMGAWPFLKLRLGNRVGKKGTHPLSRVTRTEAASPATGSAASHKIEQEDLIKRAFGLVPPQEELKH